MKTYFQLRDDMTSKDRWHLGVVQDRGGAEPVLGAGERYDGDEPLVVDVDTPGCVLEFSLTSFGIPIASGAVAKVVSSIAGDDVQCIPIEIPGQRDMFVLNAIRVIHCLDEEHSEYAKWTKKDHRADLVGQYRHVTKLVVDRGVIPDDAHFFQIGGWVSLIVSCELKMALESLGARGAVFSKV